MKIEEQIESMKLLEDKYERLGLQIGAAGARMIIKQLEELAELKRNLESAAELVEAGLSLSEMDHAVHIAINLLYGLKAKPEDLEGSHHEGVIIKVEEIYEMMDFAGLIDEEEADD